jgi:hypothetical protein
MIFLFEASLKTSSGHFLPSSPQLMSGTIASKHVPRWDRLILSVLHNGLRFGSFKKSDYLREGLSRGLDIEPEIACREG